MNRWHVRVDNKGNIDQGDIQRQLEQKANQKVSQFKTGCIISIVMAVLVVGIIAALGIYFAYVWKKSGGLDGTTASGGAAAGAKWDGTSTFSCAGNDNVAITGVTANIKSGNAIEAAGNCHLTLAGVNITAPTVISASGNAQVTVTGGNLTGSSTAIEADGNAHVTVVGAKVTGKVSKGGLAKVDGVGVAN
jgi:hypothetical protein